MPAPVFCENLRNSLRLCAELGMSHLASLIEPHEQKSLGLKALSEEGLSTGIQVHHLPIVDRQPPKLIADFKSLSDLFAEKLFAGEGVGVHCRSGIGRSGMLAASVLGKLGLEFDEALSILAARRGLRAPNTETQLRWLRENWKFLSD
ncbi:MAG: dual specificity protein phosphatase family protein [Pseudomonadota bacterium]